MVDAVHAPVGAVAACTLWLPGEGGGKSGEEEHRCEEEFCHFELGRRVIDV